MLCILLDATAPMSMISNCTSSITTTWKLSPSRKDEHAEAGLRFVQYPRAPDGLIGAQSLSSWGR
jgi:hypothetical protein